MLGFVERFMMNSSRVTRLAGNHSIFGVSSLPTTVAGPVELTPYISRQPLVLDPPGSLRDPGHRFSSVLVHPQVLPLQEPPDREGSGLGDDHREPRQARVVLGRLRRGVVRLSHSSEAEAMSLIHPSCLGSRLRSTRLSELESARCGRESSSAGLASSCSTRFDHR